MNRTDERIRFNKIKREILLFIEAMRKQNPEAAAYLEQHTEMDEQALTFKYTGDDRLKLYPPGSRLPSHTPPG